VQQSKKVKKFVARGGKKTKKNKTRGNTGNQQRGEKKEKKKPAVPPSAINQNKTREKKKVQNVPT